MNYFFSFLFITMSFFSLSYEDSLKTRKLDFMIETGLGYNTTLLNGEDTLSIITSVKRKKIGIGLFYNLTREWKIYANLEYYKLKINQKVLSDIQKFPLNFNHQLNVLHFTASL